MTEQNKDLEGKSIKNKIKNILKMKTTKNAIFFLILIICGIFIYLNKNYIKKTIFFIKDEKLTENYSEKNEILLEKKLNNLINTTYDLNEKIENNSIIIEKLQNEISYLKYIQNKNLIEPQKLELIKLAITIQNNIISGTSYSISFESFEKLILNNAFLQPYANILQKYKDIFPTEEQIKINFQNEFEIFLKKHNLLKENSNNVNKFLSNFITITQVKNHKKVDSNQFAVNLEKAILTKNYLYAYEIFTNNAEYVKDFEKTFYNIQMEFELNNSIQNIIKYLINK